MKLRPALLLPLLLLALPARGGDEGAFPPVTYPATRRVDHVEKLHGIGVADPYRWMEDQDSAEVTEWVRLQNGITRSLLDRVPGRERIRKRLTTLMDHERFRTPFIEGGRYFYWRNAGLEPQSVLWVMDSLDGEPRVLLDPNTLSEDGTRAVQGTRVSPDGRWLGYAITEGGSDWRDWRFLDVATGEPLEDRLPRTKFTAPAWSHDSEGFWYVRYPGPKEGEALIQVNESPKCYYHRLGTPVSEDRLVWEAPDEPRLRGGVEDTDDGKYEILYLGREGKSWVAIWFREAGEEAWRPLFPDHDAGYSIVDTFGPRFLIEESGPDCPTGRVFFVDVSKAGDGPLAREVVVPPRPEVLDGVSVIGGKICARYGVEGRTRVLFFSLDGEPRGELPLPGFGTALGFGGDDDDTETFYTWMDVTTPPEIRHLDLASMKSRVFRAPEIDFDGSRFETHLVKATSRDGTEVPLYVTHAKGLERDGSHPALLTGYGGFRITLRPWFSVPSAVWLEMGGVLAQAGIRGGSEYGEAWHEGGMREKKQNCFDDFIAGAEWLVKEGYTRPGRLAISGRSNGGLLVGAVLNQRPDLFGAAIPQMGVMDMLRFHRFTIGWAWTREYGSPDDPAMFPHLLAYSPYHNIRRGIAYPPTLVMTSDHDDRVVPLHSFKYAARLQAAQVGRNPILLRVETKGGHGGGLATQRFIDEVTDEWTFLAAALGIDLTTLLPE